jgi:hypothetical protein
LAAPSLNPQLIDEAFNGAIASYSEKWRHTEGLAERVLLRLAILRDITLALHAQKSRCLASGRRDLAQGLRHWEERLHELRNSPKLEGDLRELLTGTEPLKKRTRLLPEALYTAIERGKLERYDRVWEASLAAEAVTQRWQFWALEAWVEITLVEDWNRSLCDQLWPSGIVLFVESAPSLPRTPRPAQTSSEPLLWQGRWIAVVDTRIKNPLEVTSNLPGWPGSPSSPPSPPLWKLLFSPGSR